ncbi:hypothetical protein [Pseudomonas sp. KBW05]|uniref:hypothetical protein n=1 Tax=Pseudomonas sp. KBW05 TaxID=2153360 RepID=UPI000F59A324|nr:hypothetical protein [Pseudomonas sp. KBW05]
MITNQPEASPMPAPELTVQTPGDPLANTTTTTTSSTDTATDTAAPPLYVAKHKGAGKWIAVTNDEKAEQVGDFVGDKATVIPEVERLNAGGEPLVLDPQRLNEPKPATTTTTSIDATTLAQAVMTPEGWLCPEPKAKD